MLYREIMAVFSEINTKHINTLCGLNVELLNVKLAVPLCGTYSDHWTLKVRITFSHSCHVVISYPKHGADISLKLACHQTMICIISVNVASVAIG